MVFVIYNLDRPLFYYEFSKLKVKFFDGKLTSTMFSWQSLQPCLFSLIWWLAVVLKLKQISSEWTTSSVLKLISLGQ
jgi:hypothetical protein